MLDVIPYCLWSYWCFSFILEKLKMTCLWSEWMLWYVLFCLIMIIAVILLLFLNFYNQQLLDYRNKIQYHHWEKLLRMLQWKKMQQLLHGYKWSKDFSTLYLIKFHTDNIYTNTTKHRCFSVGGFLSTSSITQEASKGSRRRTIQGSKQYVSYFIVVNCIYTYSYKLLNRLRKMQLH